MQKKEIFLSLDILAKLGASEELLEFFKERYSNDSAPISEVLRELQILANTTTKYYKYVDYAKWLINNFPPTREPLVLKELTGKFLFWNGDVTIKKGIKGERSIINNGDLYIKDDVNLTGYAQIWAKNVNAIKITADANAKIRAEKTIDALKITADGDVEIWADETIDVKNITVDGYSAIDAGTIDTENIAAYGNAGIDVEETINATNIAAYGLAGIWAYEINTQSIISNGNIYAKISLIPPSSNQQNTNTAS